MVDYKEWMENSELVLVDERCSCTQPLASAGESLLAKKEYVAPKPLPELEYAYLNPPYEETKRRIEIGNANVLFPVSKSTINKDLGNNAAELDKITNTINTLKSDKDVVVTGIQIKGYASPEGSYDKNASLAKSRTEAIAQMVKGELPNGINISTDFEAEDWAGLREYVSTSSFTDKDEILSLIDSNLEPDPKEWKIKSTHPETYSKLLSECYPSLRRTEYQVKFEVKQFNVEEARSLVKTAPQKLSLDEMYSVAKTLPVGSEEYNEIYETAVRMFPNDPVANLNAANSALMRNDLVSAEKYLLKAGDSGEAITARGILAMKKGDFDQAKQLTTKAAQMGVEAAKNNLEVILTVNR
jgi:outer membrane protein OmpA-like peptidoglycan-associated protein